MLEQYFGAPSGKDHGLHDKIGKARHEGRPLPEALTRKMRYLATIRNKLVHDRGFNEIPDRKAFVAGFTEVETMLQSLLPKERGRCSLM